MDSDDCKRIESGQGNHSLKWKKKNLPDDVAQDVLIYFAHTSAYDGSGAHVRNPSLSEAIHVA